MGKTLGHHVAKRLVELGCDQFFCVPGEAAPILNGHVDLQAAARSAVADSDLAEGRGAFSLSPGQKACRTQELLKNDRIARLNTVSPHSLQQAFCNRVLKASAEVKLGRDCYKHMLTGPCQLQAITT